MNTAFKVNIFLCSSMLVACSNSSAPQSKETTSETAGSKTAATEEVFQSKLPANAPVIKVVTEGTNLPFSIKDTYGNMSGYDIDVIREIGEHEGFKVQFFKESWDNLFTSVEQGKADLAISGISYSPERAAKYALSKPYFYNPSAIMYKNPQLNLKSLSDLNGLKVGAMEGTSQFDVLKDMNAQIVPAKTPFLLYQSLIQNKADAVVIDYPILKSTSNNHPEEKVIIVPYQDKTDPKTQQVILLAKNNQTLLNKINDGIDKIQADGSLQKINDKWQIAVKDDVVIPTTSSATTTQSSATKK